MNSVTINQLHIIADSKNYIILCYLWLMEIIWKQTELVICGFLWTKHGNFKLVVIRFSKLQSRKKYNISEAIMQQILFKGQLLIVGCTRKTPCRCKMDHGSSGLKENCT
jgi:hypothetical protein